MEDCIGTKGVLLPDRFDLIRRKKRRPFWNLLWKIHPYVIVREGGC